MSDRSLRLAVFDCDGTVVDSHASIVAVMTQAFEDKGLARPDRAAVARVVGLHLTQAIAYLLPDEPDTVHVELTESYRKFATEHRRQGLWDEGLYPGAAEAIHALDRAGWLIGMATGKSRRGVADTLSRHTLERFFVTIQTPDTAPGKPDPGMLIQAMQEAGTDPERTVMIGDTTFDMEMAANAGVPALGVAWGYHDTALLKDAGAKMIVESFNEIPAAVDRLIGDGR